MDSEKTKKAKALIDEELRKIIDSKTLDISAMREKILKGLGISDQEYKAADFLPIIEQLIEKKYSQLLPFLKDIKTALVKEIDYKDIKNTPDLEALKAEVKYDDSKVISDLKKVGEQIRITSKKAEEIKGEIVKKIPTHHDELLGVKPDAHHKELHILESHLESDLMAELSRLVGGGIVDDLHIHTQPKERRGRIGSYALPNNFYTKPEVDALIAAGGGGGGVEVDPIFTASPAGGILAANIINWNTAFGWGNHATAGYLTDIVNDLSPQLGANLDCQTFNITNGGAITGTALTGTSITDSGLTVRRIPFAAAGGLLDDDANLNFNDTTKHVGIGIAAQPECVLDIAETPTFQLGVQSGEYISYSHAPAGALGGTCNAIGSYIQSRWASDLDGSALGYIYGSKFEAIGSAGFAGAINTLCGGYGIGRNQLAATATTVIGFQGTVINDDVATELGNITNAYSFLASGYTDKGTGVIATRYGLYIEDVTGGGLLTNQYAIYCPALAAASGNNYFIKNISATSDFGSGAIITTGALTNVASYNGLVVTANTGAITTGTWNGTDIAVADGGTGLGAIADGSVLAANAADTLSAITWHAAGTKILTNINGTISWEAAGAGAPTAWDDVGDPDADVSISVGGFETLITSTLNEAAHTVWTIYDSTADLTAAVTLLKLTFNDNGDADGTFLNCLDNNSGDSKFSIGVDGNTLIAGTLGVTGAITGNVTGNCSGTALTVTQAAQAAITSLGTLTTLTVDDITINGNTISSAGASTLAINPTAGQVITFDSTVTLDAGVIGGITTLDGTALHATTLLTDHIGEHTGAHTIVLDNNWTAAGRTCADAGILTTVDINGGSVDGATIGAASASTIIGTTITANTGFCADVNDGSYLGVSGTAFSDLFLASGAVIDFLAGAVTITHSANTLTIAGSAYTTLALGATNITCTGTIDNLTAAHVTTLSVDHIGEHTGAHTITLDNVLTSVNILPAADSTSDLGSSAPKYFANAYLDKVFLNSTATLDGTSAGVITGTGALTISLDMGLVATKKIYFDGIARTGDTYIYESGANVLDIYAGAANILKLGAATATFVAGAVVKADHIAETTGAHTIVFDNTITADNIIANTGIKPDADGGAYLGQAGTAFADLYLKEGGTINWDSGDAIITQTGNDITISGITSFGLGTSTAVTLGTIELGAAADTTITRSGAGAIQVEGVQVLLSGAALGTPSSGTITNCTGLPAAAVLAGSLVANMEASDHGTAATDMLVNVCYGTGAPPDANTTTEGTIYLTYTP